MATYLYCTNCTGSTQSTTVSFSQTPCAIYNQGVVGSRVVTKKRRNLTVSIPSAISCNLTVRIAVLYGNTVGNNPTTTNSYDIFITIPAGQTSATLLNQECEYKETSLFGSPRLLETWAYNLNTQPFLPSCLEPDQPEECNVTITSVSVTPPSLLGSSDGSLTVNFSGTTGSSYTFRLNAGTPQASPTFTGLAAGVYQVRIDEALCFASTFVTVPSGVFSTGDFSVNEPNKIVAAENPIMLSLATPVISPNSLPAITNLKITDAPLNGYQLRFGLTSPIAYNKTFYAKSFPDKGNYFLANELRTQQGSFIKTNTVNEIADSLAQALQDDIIISTNYFVNVTGDTVTLVSKSNSSRFNLTSSNISKFNAAGNVVTSGVTVSLVQSGQGQSQGDLLDNYNLYAEVYAPSTPIEYGDQLDFNDFNRVAELQLPYTPNNLIKFNVSDICKTFVKTDKPNYDLTGFSTVITFMQPFFIKYGEIYPLIANTNTKKKRLKGATDYFWVTNSALDYEEANDMSYYTGITNNGFLRNVPYLTNSPQRKHSSRRQRELLYFIVPRNLAQGALNVKGNVTFWDGTTLPTQDFVNITNNAINFGGAFAVNVSFDILGLDQIENTYNKLIKEVTIAAYIGTGTTRNLTKLKTYIYDLEEKTNRVGISWLNKLGGYDSFDFYGVSDESVDRSSKTYTVPLNPNVDGSLDEGFKNNATYDVTVTKKIKVNSGWINKETFDWLIELLSSNNVYIYTNQYDNYVNITGFKYSKSSNETQYNVELELIETISENNISI